MTAPTCRDGARNGDEADVDCGEACASRCAAGQRCRAGADCAAGVCATGVCVRQPDAECTDGPRDCASGICQYGRCGPAKLNGTAHNGVRDGNETDVDCGGAKLDATGAAVARCKTRAACNQGSDCLSAACGGAGTPLANTCVVAPSCSGGDGANDHCGFQDQSCCTALPVKGGDYFRYTGNLNRPGRVSDFQLDAYEISVGRIRTFLNAVGGNLRGRLQLPSGAGAHWNVPASGWRRSFDVRLPSSFAEANERFTSACAYGGDPADGGAPTWTATPGPNEAKPINCVDWYTLFAFCAWDGGRLPTDNEWGYAAQGGTENRVYAWGDDTPFFATHRDLVAGNLNSNFGLQDHQYTEGTPQRMPGDGAAHIAKVGTKRGLGRWGHADLSGNVLEYMLDSSFVDDGQCADCAKVQWPEPPQNTDQAGWKWLDASQADWTQGSRHPDGGRIVRGGSWTSDVHPLYVGVSYSDYPVWRTYMAAGGRCARDAR